MSLVNFDDIAQGERKEEISFSSVEHFTSHTRSILIKNRENLNDSIGDIIKGEDIFFINLSRWSAHDLLFYLLTITGPSKVYLTTWAISETAVRLINQAIDDKLITELYVIADRRIEVRNANVIASLRHAATKIYFVDCHAKLFVIENNEWHLSVLNTANLSNNLRMEAGHIYTNENVFTMIRETILKIIENGKPFEWT